MAVFDIVPVCMLWWLQVVGMTVYYKRCCGKTWMQILWKCDATAV